MDLATLRSSIAATRDCVYLNSGFTGPSPQQVLARMREVFETEATHGPASVEGLRQTREINEAALSAVAGLLGADEDEIIVSHGTTEGVHVVLHGLPWQPGDELVTCNLEHPAIDNPSNVLAERHGVIVKKVELPPDGGEEEVLARIGEAITPRTRIVALSHIQFSCGLRLPVKAIGEIAHERGALYFLDGAQTAGHIAIDVKDIGADFYSVSGQKWLLGPNGTGAMYIAKEHNRVIEPLFNTHAIADQRAAAQPGMGRPLARFRIASQSPALIGGFTTAISLFRDIGLEAVEAHVLSLADHLRDGIQAIAGCDLTGPAYGSCRSGLVTVTVAGWTPSQVVGELWEKYRIAARSVGYPSAVRFTCASFNTMDDIDAALTALRDIVGREPPETASDPTAGH